MTFLMAFVQAGDTHTRMLHAKIIWQVSFYGHSLLKPGYTSTCFTMATTLCSVEMMLTPIFNGFFNSFCDTHTDVNYGCKWSGQFPVCFVIVSELFLTMATTLCSIGMMLTPDLIKRTNLHL